VTRNWDAEATRLAVYVNEHRFDEHRGVIEGPEPGTAVVFGNDGYEQDARARREVEHVRERLGVMEVDVLGFGLAPPDRYTWAMIVDIDAEDPILVDFLVDLVRRGWRLANRVVRGQARDRCFRARVAAGTVAGARGRRQDASARVLPPGGSPARLSVVGAGLAPTRRVPGQAAARARNARAGAATGRRGGPPTSASRPGKSGPGASSRR
jgi:hypothetical protein